MADRPIADDRLAFNDLGKNVELFIGECHSDVFPYHARVSTDRDYLAAVHADKDVAAETQNTFRAFNRNTNVTAPAEHRHLEMEQVGAMIAPPLSASSGKEGAARCGRSLAT